MVLVIAREKGEVVIPIKEERDAFCEASAAVRFSVWAVALAANTAAGRRFFNCILYA